MLVVAKSNLAYNKPFSQLYTEWSVTVNIAQIHSASEYKSKEVSLGKELPGDDLPQSWCSHSSALNSCQPSRMRELHKQTLVLYPLHHIQSPSLFFLEACSSIIWTRTEIINYRLLAMTFSTCKPVSKNRIFPNQFPTDNHSIRSTTKTPEELQNE